MHFDLGGEGMVAEEIGRGVGADFSLLAGALAFGLVAGMWGGVVCARLPGVTAVLVVIVNGLVDVALAAIDPRVRR